MWLCRNSDKKAAIGYTYEDSTNPDEGKESSDNNDSDDSGDESSDTDVETADLGRLDKIQDFDVFSSGLPTLL